MIKITVREIGKYREVFIEHGETLVNLGMLDEEERQELIDEFQAAMDELE